MTANRSGGSPEVPGGRGSPEVGAYPGLLNIARRSDGFPRSRRRPLRSRLATVVVGILGITAAVLMARAVAAPLRLPEVARPPRPEPRPVSARRPSVQIRLRPAPPSPYPIPVVAVPERGVGGGCGSGYVHDLIVSYAWDDSYALYIASRESGCNPNARNAASGAAGVFQLMPFWWDGSNAYGWVFNPYDAAANVSYAYQMYLKSGWSPWAL